MGIVVMFGWLLLALVGLAAFLSLALRGGVAGAVRGLPAVVGALLSYGFVSAAMGVMEGVWTPEWGGFWVALAVGACGLAGIAYSLRCAVELYRTPNREGN
ncbi:MAG: hypothetical protein KDA42_15010 [Planctomycetales bacterium]|nr:hypothetical protein [Planctomycetales bacterium]